MRILPEQYEDYVPGPSDGCPASNCDCMDCAAEHNKGDCTPELCFWCRRDDRDLWVDFQIVRWGY